ncbi:MAG: hypothetical protein KDA58_10815 [Planctomycetaceae bacterium]|nr:hypothetical protein [Planctomycetaceae bacterium]
MRHQENTWRTACALIASQIAIFAAYADEAATLRPVIIQVSEHTPPGSVIGTLPSHTLERIVACQLADSAPIEVDRNAPVIRLRTTVPFDYELQHTFWIPLQVTVEHSGDEARDLFANHLRGLGASSPQLSEVGTRTERLPLIVQVLDEPEAPSLARLRSRKVIVRPDTDWKLPLGWFAVDPDRREALRFSLASDSRADFTIDPLSGAVGTADRSVPAQENRPNSVGIRVTDRDGLSDEIRLPVSWSRTIPSLPPHTAPASLPQLAERAAEQTADPDRIIRADTAMERIPVVEEGNTAVASPQKPAATATMKQSTTSRGELRSEQPRSEVPSAKQPRAEQSLLAGQSLLPLLAESEDIESDAAFGRKESDSIVARNDLQSPDVAVVSNERSDSTIPRTKGTPAATTDGSVTNRDRRLASVWAAFIVASFTLFAVLRDQASKRRRGLWEEESYGSGSLLRSPVGPDRKEGGPSTSRRPKRQRRTMRRQTQPSLVDHDTASAVNPSAATQANESSARPSTSEISQEDFDTLLKELPCSDSFVARSQVDHGRDLPITTEPGATLPGFLVPDDVSTPTVLASDADAVSLTDTLPPVVPSALCDSAHELSIADTATDLRLDPHVVVEEEQSPSGTPANTVETDEVGLAIENWLKKSAPGFRLPSQSSIEVEAHADHSFEAIPDLTYPEPLEDVSGEDLPSSMSPDLRESIRREMDTFRGLANSAASIRILEEEQHAEAPNQRLFWAACGSLVLLLLMMFAWSVLLPTG